MTDRFVKVYRLTRMGVAFCHSCIGYMMVMEDNGRLTEDARDLFCEPNEDRYSIQIGYFFRAYQVKEIASDVAPVVKIQEVIERAA